MAVRPTDRSLTGVTGTETEIVLLAVLGSNSLPETVAELVVGDAVVPVAVTVTRKVVAVHRPSERISGT